MLSGGEDRDYINGESESDFLLEGGSQDDYLVGGSGSDTLNGDQGNDVLLGGSGNDSLNGGPGDDILVGGTGNDTLNGGTSGNDTADFSDATGGVTVSLAVAGSQSVGGGLGSDTLTNIDNLVGSNFSDTLTGDGNANILNGWVGNDGIGGGGGGDTLVGGAGIDTLTGGAGNDGFRYAFSNEGGDTIVDFSAADDSIEVILSGFSGLAAGDFTGGVGSALASSRFATASSAADAANAVFGADQHFIFYDGAGSGDPSLLYYDATPTDVGADRQLIARLENGASLTASDIIRAA